MDDVPNLPTPSEDHGNGPPSKQLEPTSEAWFFALLGAAALIETVALAAWLSG
jgi:hypothetical protein